MKDKSTIVIIVLEIITVICGFIALVLQLHGSVSYENPVIGLLVFIVTSSAISLYTKLKEVKKSKKTKKR